MKKCYQFVCFYTACSTLNVASSAWQANCIHCPECFSLAFVQGWFWVCAQPMRDVVAKWRHLSLAGRKPRISPAIGRSSKSGIPVMQNFFLRTWRKCISNAVCKMLAIYYFDGLVQDCSNSIANALEILQSCTKPYRFGLGLNMWADTVRNILTSLYFEYPECCNLQ